MKKFFLLVGILITFLTFIFLSILPFALMVKNVKIGGLILLIFYSLNMIMLFDSWTNKRSNLQSKKTWTIVLLIPFAFYILYLISAKIFFWKRKKLQELHLLESDIFTNAKRKYNFDFDIDVIVGGKSKFQQLINDLSNATETINLEYFIINDGIVWQKIKSILLDKASKGVKIRIITDFIGNLQTSNNAYIDLKNSKNVEFADFNIFYIPLSSGFSNLRSHHKILVIDNKIAYFGGLNIGDDYSHLYSKYGYWFDVQFKTTDWLVKDIQKQFIIDWFRVSNQNISNEFDLIINENKRKAVDNPLIESFTDGYHYEDPVFEEKLINLINSSTKKIDLVTPYFVVPDSIINALESAVKRNVEINIYTTGIPDKKSAFFVAKYFINRVIEFGVNVYRTNDFFMHAKIYKFDDRDILFGTTNLDYRSLYLHFEHNFYIKDLKFAKTVQLQIIDELLKHSYKLSIEKLPPLGYLVKMLSPMF